jgi:hypothetical protein
MAPYGSFNEDALAVWDFVRCQRPDGSVYGSRGKCNKGAEIGPKEEVVAKPKKTREKKVKELVAKATPEQKKIEKVPAAKKSEEPAKPPKGVKEAIRAKAQAGKHPLNTSEDYDKLLKTSLKDKEALAAHKRARNFDPKSKSSDRLAFEKAMGGKEQANQALKNITDFGALYFSAIRGAQRGDFKYFKDKSLMEEYKQKAATIEKAIRAMPHPDVEKYRGMSVSNKHLKSLIKQAKDKGSYKSDALDSWSTNLQTADQFARRRTDDEYPNSVVFRTRNKNGASIRPFSPVPGEDEILTPSGSSYRFTGYSVIERNGEKIHVFEIDES